MLAERLPLVYRARYRGRWAAVLRAWKLGRRHDLTAPLAVEAGAALAGLRWSGMRGPVLLVPVPPRAVTLRRRGVDLVGGLVAEVVIDRPSLDALPALSWNRQPGEQVGGGRRARWTNVAGALQADPAVAGRSVVVCDDITTTGATLLSAAGALTAAGAAQVAALTLGAVREDDPAAPGGPVEG